MDQSSNWFNNFAVVSFFFLAGGGHSIKSQGIGSTQLSWPLWQQPHLEFYSGSGKMPKTHSEMANCKCLLPAMSLFHPLFFSDLVLRLLPCTHHEFFSINNWLSERSGKFVTYALSSLYEQIVGYALSKVQGFNIVSFHQLHLHWISRNMSMVLFLSFLLSE